ncbi:MAG: molybdopterin-dependent oxidoreductase [Rudaea sp.]|nr:molybdopterin-dependent oxidoreductase [Rudaea sp.]
MSNLPKLAGAAASTPQLSRRGFLIGAAGAGFTLAFLSPGSAFADPAAAVAERNFEPTIWYHIDHDGIVTVNIMRAEMGQHVGTALARIVADELEANWDSVRINAVDTDPKWGLMVTGGSWSVWQSFPYLSQAGAAGRITLIEEAAKLLGVSRNACTARNGVVSAGGKSISYADIVRKGNLARVYTADELKAMPIKKAADRRLIGTPMQAIDIPSKTNGSARYGLDAEVDGMVFARPKLPPTRNSSKVVSIDDSAARDLNGYIKTLALDDPSGTVPGWVVVVADSFVAADRAAKKVNVVWASGDATKVSEKDILDHGTKLIDDPKGGSLVVADEGVDEAFATAKSKLEQTYTTSTVLHFQLEPLNALAFEKNGIWEIHTGNQWQSLILPTLAKALGVGEDKVVMRTYLLGGGFGRRLNGDYAVPAALASKALGKPVKLVFTRADDVLFDSPRSASVQRVRMAFGEGGRVIGMQHDASAGWPTQVMIPSFMPKGKNGEPYDPFAISGADHWYSVGAHRVRAISNDLANSTFRPGWLRSVGPGWTNWALESFMDEAAHVAGIDPVAFRISLLDAKGKNAGDDKSAVGGAARQANVVRRAAEKAGWGGTLPKDTGLGIATTFGQERDMPTWTACVARVKVDRRTGMVRLEKLTVVVDAGTIVHPDGALAQVEGASLWGASMALHEGTEFVNGQVRDTNLDTYTPLRMRDVPEMDIEFVSSTESPVGLGEPATTVTGPAIGNAIFAAVGARLRHIPIRPEAVLQALAATSVQKS